MKKMINETHIIGWIYESKLQLKVSGANSKNPGTEFISGDLSIATDDACTNIVPVHFSYVTATFGASGKPNSTFSYLKDVINGKVGTIMTSGKDTAGKVRIDSAIGLNDFYSDRNGTTELISAKRNDGGFVHPVDAITDDEKTRNTFKCDMVITKVTRKEADPDRNLPEQGVIHGAIFDFRKAILPVDFVTTNANAINYFEGLEPSSKHPVFTKIWGRQMSSTVVRTITEESAFGDAEVRTIESSRKEWVITGAAPEVYAWDDEDTITAKELSEALANRETYLATVKQRSDEYQASRNGGAATPAATGDFKF